MLQTSTTRTVHNRQSDWRHRAACRDEDPELFHPVGDEGPALVQIAAAKAVCARCPVVADCLSFALIALPESVAGGLTAQERAEQRRRRRLSGPPVTKAVDGVDTRVVASLVAGERVSGASRQELALAVVELHQAGHGPRRIGTQLGVTERRVHRWLQRHRAGQPLTVDRRVGRVSA